MAGSIKGITIEFRGNPTPLKTAIRDIEKETAKLDKEIKQVDKALKFNPTNVDLWRQKQQLLTQKISETKEKLTLLKNEQARLDAAGVDKNSEEYRKLQREIIETESKLKTFEGQLKAIGNVNLRAASEQMKQLGTNLTNAGEAMRGLSVAAAAVTAAIGALTVKSGQWADDMNTMSKRYSISTGDLQKYSAAADLVDVSVEDIAKTHVKLEKSMLSASKGTGSQAEAFDKLGVSVTDSNGELRDADEVWQETISKLGEMTNETERDALAQQLLGKTAANLNPLIEDGGETYKRVAETMQKYGLDFIDQETLDKANEFNDELDTIKAIGLVTFQSLGTELAGYLAPAIEKVVGWVGKFAEWLSKLSPQTLTIIATIAGVLAVVSPLLIGLGKLSFAISSIISLMATIGPAIGGLLATAGPIVLVIAAIVAAGILLYKNWDKIKAKAIEIKDAVSSTFNSLKSTVSSIWNGIKSAITSPIESAKNTLQGIMSKIKGYFPIKLGKLINFSIPSISLNTASKTVLGKTITYPTGFSVSWHKQGAIFTRPTLMVGADGQYHGVGDVRGGEAVLPIENLQSMIDASVAKNNASIMAQQAQQTQLLAAMLDELKKNKNIMIDDRWAGRYIDGLGFIRG